MIMPNSRSLEEQLILEHFGKRLRELRSSKDLTQEDLAIKAGFSRSYYTEIETGKRNISLLNLYRIAQCLNVSLSDLLTFKLE
jgi:transcriptional regulator with XRE-family HTH domain